ncbi:MAG: phytanoyl-CoA dioxygenase family protein [Alphaproteobacteria bacterium]
MLHESHSPIVDPSSLRPLVSDAAVNVYRQTGLLVAPDFLGQEDISLLQRESERLRDIAQAGSFEKWRTAPRPTVDGNMIWERIDPLIDVSPPIDAFSRSPDILNIAAALIDDEPALLKDHLIYKFPGDRGYLLHQDQRYFHDSTAPADKVVRIAFALDPLTMDNGTVNFYRGYQSAPLPSPEDEPRDVCPDAVDRARGWPVIAAEGTLIAFHTLTPHESGPNRSNDARRMLYLTYVAKAYSGSRSKYYAGRRKAVEDF